MPYAPFVLMKQPKRIRPDVCVRVIQAEKLFEDQSGKCRAWHRATAL